MNKLQLLALGALLAFSTTARAAEEFLNVSYDVTREFYRDYNAAFAKHWAKTSPAPVTFNQSHGGSSKQIRAVAEGLQADVVTMNQPTDIDQLTKAGLIPADWSKRLPNASVPYHSTILFLVRKGNPRKIADWPDLARPGVAVIIPNPKTSGNGRYSYLAAWGYALRQNGGDETKAREFVTKFIANVPIFDAGGRGATTTFAQRGIGDVLLTFENEVSLLLKELGDGFEAVTPSTSILAENPVTWVDKVVKKKGHEKLAEAYLSYLFEPEAQEIAALHGYRPTNPEVLKKHADRFKPIPLFSVAETFGSWDNASKIHFSDGGVFDQIQLKK